MNSLTNSNTSPRSKLRKYTQCLIQVPDEFCGEFYHWNLKRLGLQPINYYLNSISSEEDSYVSDLSDSEKHIELNCNSKNNYLRSVFQRSKVRTWQRLKNKNKTIEKWNELVTDNIANEAAQSILEDSILPKVGTTKTPKKNNNLRKIKGSAHRDRGRDNNIIKSKIFKDHSGSDTDIPDHSSDSFNSERGEFESECRSTRVKKSKKSKKYKVHLAEQDTDISDFVGGSGPDQSTSNIAGSFENEYNNSSSRVKIRKKSKKHKVHLAERDTDNSDFAGISGSRIDQHTSNTEGIFESDCTSSTRVRKSKKSKKHKHISKNTPSNTDYEENISNCAVSGGSRSYCDSDTSVRTPEKHSKELESDNTNFEFSVPESPVLVRSEHKKSKKGCKENTTNFAMTETGKRHLDSSSEDVRDVQHRKKRRKHSERCPDGVADEMDVCVGKAGFKKSLEKTVTVPTDYDSEGVFKEKKNYNIKKSNAPTSPNSEIINTPERYSQEFDFGGDSNSENIPNDGPSLSHSICKINNTDKHSKSDIRQWLVSNGELNAGKNLLSPVKRVTSASKRNSSDCSSSSIENLNYEKTIVNRKGGTKHVMSPSMSDDDNRNEDESDRNEKRSELRVKSSERSLELSQIDKRVNSKNRSKHSVSSSSSSDEKESNYRQGINKSSPEARISSSDINQRKTNNEQASDSPSLKGSDYESDEGKTDKSRVGKDSKDKYPHKTPIDSEQNSLVELKSQGHFKTPFQQERFSAKITSTPLEATNCNKTVVTDSGTELSRIEKRGEVSSSDSEQSCQTDDEKYVTDKIDRIKNDVVPKAIKDIQSKLISGIKSEYFEEDLLYIDDLSDSEDVWVAHCPKSLRIDSLVGKKLNLSGRSKFSASADGNERLSYEAFSTPAANSEESMLFCLLPNKKQRAIKSAGRITVEERIEITSSNTVNLTSNLCLTLPESLPQRHPLLGAGFRNNVTTPSSSGNDTTPLRTKKKKKKKYRKEGIEDGSADKEALDFRDDTVQNSSQFEESAQLASDEVCPSASKKKHKKKKKHKTESEENVGRSLEYEMNESYELLEDREVTDGDVERLTNTKKKKKSKHKKEIEDALRQDSEFTEGDVERLNTKKKNKIKNKKEIEKEDELLEVEGTEEVVERLNKKKKKKSKLKEEVEGKFITMDFNQKSFPSLKKKKKKSYDDEN